MSRSGRSSNGDRLSPPSTSLSTNHEIPVIFDQDAYRESVNRDMDESFLVEDPSLTDLQQRRGGRDQASDSDSDDDDNNSNDGDNTVDFQELRRMVEDGEIDDRDFEEELERVQEVFMSNLRALQQIENDDGGGDDDDDDDDDQQNSSGNSSSHIREILAAFRSHEDMIEPNSLLSATNRTSTSGSDAGGSAGDKNNYHHRPPQPKSPLPPLPDFPFVDYANEIPKEAAPFFNASLYQYFHCSPFINYYQLPIKHHQLLDVTRQIIKHMAPSDQARKLLFGKGIENIDQVAKFVLDTTLKTKKKEQHHSSSEPSSIEASLNIRSSSSNSPHLDGGGQNQRSSLTSIGSASSGMDGACGHVFKKGEVHYRCKDCSVDNSVVMCSKCYQSTDHDGHEVTFSIASGKGGFCDCGLKEAWKVDINCRFHPLTQPETSTSSKKLDLPQDIQESIRKTLSTCLDFIIDTFAESEREVLVAWAKSSVEHDTPLEPYEKIFLSKLDPVHLPGGKARPLVEGTAPDESNPTEKMSFVHILWKSHKSLEDIVNKLTRFTHCSIQKAVGDALISSSHGRHIIQSTCDFKKIDLQANLMYDGAGEGILTTIKCAREAFREEIAAFLLMFLRTLPTCLQHFYNHNKKKLKRRTSKSYKPEQIGNEIEEMDRYEQSDKLSKRIICEELTRERRYLKHIFSQAGGITSTDINLNSAPSTVAMKPSTEKSAQDRDLETIENESEWQTYPDISIPGFDSKITKLRSPLLTETIRLDCLMLFDDRLWTEIRVALNEIISMMLVSGEDVKKILAHRFARNYLKIAEAYLFIDREPALSIMDVSGIIFSISVISNQLISETPIMASIICFIKAYFLMGPLSFDTIFDSYSQSKRLKLKDYPYLECTSSNYRHPRYWRLFSDFHCLLSACRAAGNGTTQRGGIATDYFRQLGDLIRNNSASTNATTPSALRDLKLLIDLLSMFQEMNMQKRQHDSHVEYEDESWVDAFNLTLRLMNTIKEVVNCVKPLSNAALEADSLKVPTGYNFAIVVAVRMVAEALTEWCYLKLEQPPRTPNLEPAPTVFSLIQFTTSGERYRIIRFKVSSEPVSFHHPLQWLLACLLSQIPQLFKVAGSSVNFLDELKSRKDIWQLLSINTSSDQQPDISENPNQEDKILMWIDYPLRVCSFLAQLKAGLWVRNGSRVRYQSMHYRERTIRECFDQDILLLQLAMVLVNHDRLLVTFVERFELTNWFNGHVQSPFSSDFKEMAVLAEELLQLLIILITERMIISGSSVQDQMKREIMHHLATNPYGISYSQLTDRIPDHLVDRPDSTHTSAKLFDEILAQVSVFKLPDGADHGVYELKDAFYEDIDPWFWHYTGNQRDEINDVLRKRRIKAKKAGDPLPSSTTSNQKIPFWDLRLGDEGGGVADVYLPKITPLNTSLSEFGNMNNLVGCGIFVHLVFFGLWNVTRSDTVNNTNTTKALRSDGIFSSAIHLCLVALSFEKQEDSFVYNNSTESNGPGIGFIEKACTQQVHTAHLSPTSALTLLGLLLSLLERSTNEDFLIDYVQRIKLIVSKFEEASWVASSLIQEWRAQSSCKYATIYGNSKGEVVSDGLTDFERKKAAARARKTNLMAHFAAAQQSFLDSSGDELEKNDNRKQSSKKNLSSFDLIFGQLEGVEDEEQEDEQEEEALGGRIWNYPIGNCIMCQEEANKKSNFYGMLGLTQCSRVVRHIDFRNSKSLTKALQSNASLDLDLSAAAPSSFTTAILKGQLSAILNPDYQSSSSSESGSPIGSMSISSRGEELHDSPAVAGSPVKSWTPGSPIGSPSSGLKSISGSPNLTENLPDAPSSTSLYSSSCGHLIHFKCYLSYKSTAQSRPNRDHDEEDSDLNSVFFLCPLCKSLCNCFLPIFKNEKREFCNWNGSINSNALSQSQRKRKQSIKQQALISMTENKIQDWWGYRVLQSFFSQVSTKEGTAETTAESYVVNEAIEKGQLSKHYEEIVSMDSIVRHQKSLAEAGGDSSAALPEDEAPAYSPDYISIMCFKLVSMLKSINKRADRTFMSMFGIMDSQEALTLMYSTYAATITGMEIMSRGGRFNNNAEQITASARSTINSGYNYVGILEVLAHQQNLNTLRVLGDAILTETCIVCRDSVMEIKLYEYSKRCINSLFFGLVKSFFIKNIEHALRLEDGDDTKEMMLDLLSKPVLTTKDTFNLLVDCSFTILPIEKDFNALNDVFKWIELFWILNTVKVIVAVLESVVSFEDKWVEDVKLKSIVQETVNNSKNYSTVSGIIPPLEELVVFVKMIMASLDIADHRQGRFLQLVSPSFLLLLIRQSNLVFLRKCVIFVHANFGIVPPYGELGFEHGKASTRSGIEDGDDEEDECRGGIKDASGVFEDETGRISAYLNLPHLVDLFTKTCAAGTPILTIIQGWCSHFTSIDPFAFSSEFEVRGGGNWAGNGKNNTSNLNFTDDKGGIRPASSRAALNFVLREEGGSISPTPESSSVGTFNTTASLSSSNGGFRRFKLPSPALLQLVSLPIRYDLLIKDTLRNTCKRCNSADPALCLLCGKFVCTDCSASPSDLRDTQCDLSKPCGGDVGIFMPLKDCIILFLHGKYMAILKAPYLDNHGENKGLERGRPLFLNKSKFNEIRRLYLAHSIPTYVAVHGSDD